MAIQTEESNCRRWTFGFYWMPCLYFTLLHMIFVGSIRYREPALLVLTIVGGVGTTVLWQKLFDCKKLTMPNVEHAALKN